jgi:hypothetical protein
MVEQAKELDWLLLEDYVPSSIERKKAVMMYFFVWIVVALSKDTLSVYEYFHLKQALWWWSIFFMAMVFWVFFLFLPYLWVIPLVIFLSFMIVWALFCKQAREGRYTIDTNKILLPFFAWFWEWILSIFEIDVQDANPDHWNT